MPFVPCISVPDTTASVAFYQSIGFTVDSSSATAGDDLHMLLYQGQLAGMLYGNTDLKTWLPVLKDQPIGFAGMFYLSVSDFQAAYDRVSRHADIVKEPVTDNNGVREFYFRDTDGYVIGINDHAALKASDMGRFT
ncbi:VOC family protein [Streptomyces sp. NPDC099050]|uniref:VOC family protein n=1 Tax=Streptomyces sp. NPDC099050 TaxID=3366100 RepID=UPI0037FC4B38